MADLIRTPKSGDDWKQSDLRAYNIRVVFQDAVTFFGGPLLQPMIRPEFLATEYASDAQDDDLYNFLALLKLSTPTPPEEDSAVNDFVVSLFREMKYIRKGRVARTRMDYGFSSDLPTTVRPDVCIFDPESERILLLVQEDKRHLDGWEPEPPLIAEAISAFGFNEHRDRFKRPELEACMLPGITMTGTSPTFYKIPVTNALCLAVEDGEYPFHETVVYAHLPELPRPHYRFSEGMLPLDNRHILLSCFEAFRQFVQ